MLVQAGCWLKFGLSSLMDRAGMDRDTERTLTDIPAVYKIKEF